MQQLGSYVFVQDAKLADLRRKLAAADEHAKLNQMVRDHEEYGVSS